MAVLRGYSQPSTIFYLETNANLPASEFNRIRELLPVAGDFKVTSNTLIPPSTGAKRNHVSIFGGKKKRAGFSSPSFLDDIYYRVWFIPLEVDLGVFSTDTGVQVMLWNAFLENKDLTLIEGVETTGLDLSGTLPTETLQSHSVSYYDVEASADEGPSAVDAQYLFTIGGVVYTLAITGSRAVFFPFLPNWTNGVGEKLAWNTAVFRSKSGKVSAESFTENPGQSFTWSSILEEKQYQFFENMVWNAQWRDFLIAIPTDIGWSSLSAGANADDLTLFLEGDEFLSFQGGQLVVLFVDYQAFEVAEIQAYTNGQIVLERAIKQNWPIGTSIFPVTSAHLGNNQSTSAHTDGVVSLSFNWQCDPVVNLPFLPVEAAPLIYNGYELYLVEPNRVRPGKMGFQSDYAAFSQPNAVYRHQKQDHSTISRTYEWLLSDREQIYDFRAFLRRRGGYSTPCYLPLWQSAFLMLEKVFSDGDQIIVEDNKFSQFVGAHPARAHILMLLSDGSFLPHEITAVTKQPGGNILLDLAAPVGRDIEPEEVVRIYNLPLMRMSDIVSFKWDTNGVMVPTISFSAENP